MKNLSWMLLPVMLLGLPVSATNSEKTLDQLMSQWLNLESQKGRLQSEWNIRKTELERRLSLMDTEQNALKEVVSKTSEATSDVDQRRLALLKMQDELEQEQTLVTAQLDTTIAQIDTLKIKLPPPLQQEWNEKLPLLAQKGVSNSEKLDRLLSLLKLAEEFNNRIALHRSPMNLPNTNDQPQAVLVTQIYLGNSQGWYVSDDAKYYGYGRATSLGWQWWHGEQASAELGRTLNPETILNTRSILENPTTAKFISLPIKI